MKRSTIHHAIIAAGILSCGFAFWYFLAPGGSRPFTVDELRAMLIDGQTPQQRARGAAGLGERKDTPSMPLLLATMEDEEPLVRAQAAVAVTKILGADFHFEPEDLPERRTEVIGKYRALWEAWKEKTGYDGELILPEDNLPSERE